MGGAENRVYTDSFDVDIKSSYPSASIFMNTSKETTEREVVALEGISESEQRRLGVNLTAVRSNAIDLGRGFYGLPTLHNLLNDFEHQLQENK